MEIRPVLHIILHFLIPFSAAYYFYNKEKWQAFWVMSATLIVDLDHLLAVPVYDPCRCSIGFHPFHSPIAIGIYALLSVAPTNRYLRWIGIGLMIHMLLDWADCVWMKYFV